VDLAAGLAVIVLSSISVLGSYNSFITVVIAGILHHYGLWLKGIIAYFSFISYKGNRYWFINYFKAEFHMRWVKMQEGAYIICTGNSG